MGLVKVTIINKDGTKKTKLIEISEREQLAMFRYCMDHHYLKYTPPPLEIPKRKK